MFLEVHLFFKLKKKYICNYTILTITICLEMQERVSNIAYNIVNGLCTPISDQSAPVYITIGDGGNLEGLATEYV